MAAVAMGAWGSRDLTRPLPSNSCSSIRTPGARARSRPCGCRCYHGRASLHGGRVRAPGVLMDEQEFDGSGRVRSRLPQAPIATAAIRPSDEACSSRLR